MLGRLASLFRKEIYMVGSKEFLERCRQEVAEYFNANADVTDDVKLEASQVYVVWYAKELQNHKAMLSTPIPDGLYYEITYNGTKDELYIDVYKKWENIKVSSAFKPEED